MKKSLRNLVKGGIETIIIIVVLVAVVVGLFATAVLPMIRTADNTADAAQTNLNTKTTQWMAGNFR